MRALATSLLVLLASASLGCSVLLPVIGVATAPLDKKGTFEEAQQAYTANLRYGLFEDAKTFVEPALQPDFDVAIQRLREVRFSDYRVESVDIDALRAQATAVVVYRGYWLSSPYEREVRVVQQWRRVLPTQEWYVTPDWQALLGPGVPQDVSAN